MVRSTKSIAPSSRLASRRRPTPRAAIASPVCPRGRLIELFLEPGAGLPYTKATFHVPAESPAFEPVTFDIALKRGVLVRGRVTDKSTGQPVWGTVTAYTFADNPHVDEYPGYRDSREAYARVDNDGRYEIVALPGRGIIACWSDSSRYRRGVGARAIKGYEPEQDRGILQHAAE